MSVTTGTFRVTLATQDDAIEPLRRLTPAAYDDGAAEPRQNDPSDPDYVDAAQVALQVVTQGNRSIENTYGLSALWIFWGQFLDHDLDLTLDQGPSGELLKDDTSVFNLDVFRSQYEIIDGVAEQMNIVTPFIDASNVYGSTLALQSALRTGSDGLLKTSTLPDGSPFLPTEAQVFEGGRTDVYIAGDIRAQENTGLTSIHATFVNEHNYWAARIAAADPTLTDEQIFQQAKAVIEALIQKITYEEFLPVLLGTALPEYTGYQEGLDVQIFTEFSTAAFRFGHTAIPDTFTFLAEDGAESRDPASLFELFNNADTLFEVGIDDTLRGLLAEKAQQIDALVVDSLNLFLFTPDGGMTGFSLPERNLLRGRDHGIDTYINVRAQVVGDIDAADYAGSTDFSVITSDPALQQSLAAVYGTVDRVDLWIGGLAEDHVPGVTIGITFQTILVQQFTLLRDGDPYFYLNRDWAGDAIFEEIMDTRLSDILMRSAGIDYVQHEAMLASNRIGGTDKADMLHGTAGRDLIIGFAGNDKLHGKEGDDDIFGGAGGDHIKGEAGNDAIWGGVGQDRLEGGDGDDLMSGGDGRDILIGGAGRDQFVFFAGETDVDMVRDFEVGEDLLVLKYFNAGFEDLELGFQRGTTTVAIHGVEIVQLNGNMIDKFGPDDVVFIA